MSELALEAVDIEDMALIVEESMLEFGTSTLLLVRPSATQTYDADFGNPTGTIRNDSFRLHYSQFVSSPTKEESSEKANFVASQKYTLYVSSKEVKRVLPDGNIHREQDIIIINGIEFVIDAIIAYPQQHNTSILQKLKLTSRRPTLQGQGDNGA